jgi:hypothetical protein
MREEANMVERLYKKGLVVGIIVLFIGLAVIPSINANYSRIPIKSKFVETSVRIHGARSITPFTLRLTERESKEVDIIFDNLRISLDSAETGEEIDEIFDNAVESLHKLGMFPKMTIKEAKQLVNCRSVKSPLGNLGTRGENFNCKIAGETTHTYMCDLGNEFLNDILERIRNPKLFFLIWRPFNLPYYLGKIGYIAFSRYEYGFGPYDYYDRAFGWVFTNGSNGVVTWRGHIRGDLFIRVVWADIDIVEIFMGVKDFNGLFIDKYDKPPCYLGNAEHVNLVYT